MIERSFLLQVLFLAQAVSTGSFLLVRFLLFQTEPVKLQASKLGYQATWPTAWWAWPLMLPLGRRREMYRQVSIVWGGGSGCDVGALSVRWGALSVMWEL